MLKNNDGSFLNCFLLQRRRCRCMCCFEESISGDVPSLLKIKEAPARCMIDLCSPGSYDGRHPSYLSSLGTRLQTESTQECLSMAWMKREKPVLFN